MMDDEIIDSKYDPVINEEDRCSAGGGHRYIEAYVDEKVQVLKCSGCGKESVGYFTANTHRS